MIENEELLTIVPHRGKMLLLKRVINYNLQELSIEAECQIDRDCIFYDNKAAGVPAWVGFEYIAQTVSAFIGIKNRERKINKIGLIMSIYRMHIGLPIFQSGSIITIKAKEVDEMDSVHVFLGEIFLEGKKVMEGKLTVMDVDDEKAVMKKENIGE